MDQILQVFLVWILVERPARVCSSELRLSPSQLGCRLEVLFQLHRHYASCKGNVNPLLMGFSRVVDFQRLTVFFFRILQLLGDATEQLSLRLGETLSGLLNASFGNAVEIIVGVAALLQGPLFPCFIRFRA